MPTHRLLAIDIDGTLVNSRDELTPATCAALRRAGDAGVQVVLATGRRYSRALPLAEQLGIDVPLVTANGALIKDPRDHRTLFQATFSDDVLRRTLRVIADAGYDAVLYGDSFSAGFDYYSPPHPPAGQPELAEYYALNPRCERIEPDLMRRPPAGIFAGFAIGAHEAMVDLETRLERALPGELYVHVVRSPRYTGYFCEIAPAGVSKWSGVLHLAEQWGLSASEICAVGDEVNDLPMIRGAGLGVAMGNAPAPVRAAADRIAPRHDDDGLVAVVDWLVR